MSTAIESEFERLVRTFLDSPEKDWWVRDLTEAYPWLRGETILHVIDTNSDKAVMVVRSGVRRYECLSCPTGAAVIGRLIAAHLKGIPAPSLDIPHSAELLMDWYRDPRGYVLTPAFFEQQRSVLSSFLTGEEKDPNALKAVCTDPEFTKYGDSWKLRFNALNRQGGVELWLAQGRRADQFTIDSIDIRILKRDGTFYYPNEL